MAEGTTIGQSVEIKGDLRANEDLTIEGQVDGKIALDENAVTIGTAGRIKAEVRAKVITVLGTVHGNITATERIVLQQGAVVHGDLTAPNVALVEGASFQGTIDMQRSQDSKAVAPTKD